MKRVLIFLFLWNSFLGFAANEITVAKDGSGDFNSIQAALNSIPLTNSEWVTVLVKNGVYDEHVMIKSSFVAIVGESRSGTRIEHNLPRAVWYAANGVNTGTGVINVASNLHDIVIANMFIRNTFEGSEDYTEVIRTETGTTRIWVENCDVLCLWKDTFAPWGKAGGMYYVSDCAFRGSIDAFCPRGYCYAINCRFTETKSSSPIWHEGVATEDQKLVIQGGSVHSEYNKNVKLQNSQNYAKFYYLDVQLSDSITALGTSSTTYFYGVKGLSGLSWFGDNLTLTNRKPMDAVWTFDAKWDPENTMPSVLPYVALPQPYNGRYALASGNSVSLKWTPARNAVSHKIYFGTSEQPTLFAETADRILNSPVLESNKTYYWKVNTVTSSGEIEGKLWRFTTSDAIDPVTQASLMLSGKNNQTILLGTAIELFSYTMKGATKYTVSGLPDGVSESFSENVISISGTPTAKGTFTISIETTDALANARVSATIVVKDENDTIPDAPTETDYTSLRLTKYRTLLDCKAMPQEPAWITKSGSVSWSAGTGYKWGSTSAVLTLKVSGCSKVECTFTNSSTSRPIIISDGGSSNDKTAYPSAANVETIVSFVPKTNGSDDISFKTTGSSGMSITKLVLFGVTSAVQEIDFNNEHTFSIQNGNISSFEPMDIYTISGQQICNNKKQFGLSKGLYIIRCKNKFSKISIN